VAFDAIAKNQILSASTYGYTATHVAIRNGWCLGTVVVNDKIADEDALGLGG
jgi:hypothetical protein